ncbi:MAG: hypothetical protein KGQ51_19920 [Planctomycetes bacterium]|nr:hypothetical protein [Planctomycetota bacterium]
MRSIYVPPTFMRFSYVPPTFNETHRPMQLDEIRNDEPDRTWAQRSIALKIRWKSKHDKNWASLRPTVSRYRLSLFHFQYREAFLESIGHAPLP